MVSATAVAEKTSDERHPESNQANHVAETHNPPIVVTHRIRNEPRPAAGDGLFAAR